MKSGPKSFGWKTLHTFDGGGGVSPRFLLLLLALSGCYRYVFSVKGTVASDGGALGRWHSKPQGCSRDPEDGLPIGQTHSLVTLLWEDPAAHDPKREQHLKIAPHGPMRLDIAREDSGLAATLNTVKTHGTHLDATNCTLLRADTEQHKPDIREGKPTLAGRVQMDCRTGGSHLTADVTFTRCEY